jgi:Condensation domain
MTQNELAAATAVDYDPFAGAPLSRLVPTTEPQREVWLASRLEPEASLAYNEAVSINLKGLLDVPALEAALQAIVDRHEALRATFSSDGEGLFVAEHTTLPVAFHDLSLLAPFESDARIMGALPWCARSCSASPRTVTCSPSPHITSCAMAGLSA